jgi:hypothetical protein
MQAKSKSGKLNKLDAQTLVPLLVKLQMLERMMHKVVIAPQIRMLTKLIAVPTQAKALTLRSRMIAVPLNRQNAWLVNRRSLNKSSANSSQGQVAVKVNLTLRKANAAQSTTLSALHVRIKALLRVSAC